MYKSHFGLNADPFDITPDSNFFIPTNAYLEAFNLLATAVKSGAGFIKITGEVGTGKTLLCRNFLESLGPEYIKVYIHNPYLEPNTLLLALADELNLPLGNYNSNDQHQLLKLLANGLSEITEQAKYVIVGIDEAQAMPLQSLEALRLLTNLETEKQKLLKIILFGQPELDEKLNKDSVRQLLQRIIFQHRLMPMAANEIAHYLAHRLNIAGYQGGMLFLPDAVQTLYRASQGTPRLINILAHKSLLLAYQEGSRQIKKAIVLAAIADTPAAKQTYLNRFLTTFSWRWRIISGITIISLLIIIIAWRWLPIFISQQDNKLVINQLPTELNKPVLISSQDSAKNTNIPNQLSPELNQASNNNILNNNLPITSPSVTAPELITNINNKNDNNANNNLTTSPQIISSTQNLAENQQPPPAINNNIQEKLPKDINISINENELTDRTEWLLKQNPKDYTLIILNQRKKLNTLKEFTRNHDNVLDLGYFRSMKQGKEVFTMIYGIYPNKTKARQAAQMISKQWENITPFIRRIKTIHNKINNFTEISSSPEKNAEIKPKLNNKILNQNSKPEIINSTPEIVVGQFKKSVNSQNNIQESYEAALLLLKQKEFEQARERLKEILIINPNYHNARLALANLALTQNDYATAEQILSQGLKLDAKNAHLAFHLARIIVERGDSNTALTILRSAQPSSNENPQYHAFIGALEQRLGNNNAAIDEYRAALRLSPNNGIWLMGIGISLIAEQKFAEAAQNLRLALNSEGLNNELRSYIKRQLQVIVNYHDQ